MEHHLAAILVIVIGAGILAQWLSWRFRVPAIVLLSASGLLLGPVFGVTKPSVDLGPMLQPIIGLAVAIILFEGGLSLRFNELKREGGGIVRLVVLGLPLSFAFGFLAARFVGGRSVEVALLFAAIMTVTGPTVIIPLLRHARLARRPASLLKWEGIVNDPLGAILAVLIFEFVVLDRGHASTIGTIGMVALSVVIAIGLSIGGRGVLRYAFFRGYVPEYLKAPVMFAAVLAVYTIANLVQSEAGLLAVTAFGVAIGNTSLASLHEIRRFKEFMTTLLVSSVFVLLTADLDVRVLSQLDHRSILLLLTMLFVVRPAALLLATLRTKLTMNERLFIGLIAPRGIVAGAVAGAFGTALVGTDIVDAELLVPLTFGMIFSTVTLHGFGVRWLARRLGLANEDRPGVLIVGASPWTAALARHLSENKVSVLLADPSWGRLRSARMAGVRVYYGEVLEDPHDGDVDLSEFGVMLAASENSAYNALACVSFGPVFGRDRVYLLTAEADHEAVGDLDVGLRGHVLVSRAVTLRELGHRFAAGWRFKTTTFSDKYTLEDHRVDLPEGGMPIARITAAGRIDFNAPGKEIHPRAGDRLLTFVPPEPIPDA